MDSNLTKILDIHFDLGNMKDKNGTILRYEVESLTSALSKKIVTIINKRDFFQKISKNLKRNDINLYFLAKVKSEINFSICQLSGLRWKKLNLDEAPLVNKIFVPKSGIFPILKEIWPDEHIKLVLSNNYILSESSPTVYEIDYFRVIRTYRFAKKKLKSLLDLLRITLNKIINKNFTYDLNVEKNNLALEFNEGINLNQRSDIAWLQNELIDKSRIIIYFSSLDVTNNSKKISKKIIEDIKEMGITPVCIKPAVMYDSNFPIWIPIKKRIIPNQNISINNDLDYWINKKGIELIDGINYWVSFYKEFNIKINFIIGEGHPKYLIQKMACELEVTNSIIVRKQRSELYTESEMFPFHHTVNIFFTFNNRAKKYLLPNVNNIKTLVSTGHTSDYLIKKDRSNIELLKNNLINKGVKYTICLLDNVYSKFYDTSKEEINLFYNTFLDLLFEDSSIGIIIKSKKPMVIDGLPEISKKVKEAEETGRCIRIKNEWGRFPLEAALVSDLSVGVSISSAIIEIATMGLPAVMYDMTRLYTHEFYSEGKDKIIFDNLEVLVEKIKDKRNNINSSLGQWKDLNYELDSFNDGKSNYRIEEYINNCLDGFDHGLNANDVIEKANKQYSQNWGSKNIHKLD